MRRGFVIIITIFVWVIAIGYLLWASHISMRGGDGVNVINKIEVVVLDSADIKVITPLMVKGWFAQEKMKIVGAKIDSVNTMKIQEFVEKRGFVKRAKVYSDLRGVLTIELTQRKPIIRVSCYNGYNFYVTDDDYILPLQSHETIYTPVVTGVFDPPFSRKFVGNWRDCVAEQKKKFNEHYIFFEKLINFVKYVTNDNYWSAQIVQFNVIQGAYDVENKKYGEPEVEIIPRVGNQVVLLGQLNDVEEKLEKLLLFYSEVLSYEDWERPVYINLKFKNQVICK